MKNPKMNITAKELEVIANIARNEMNGANYGNPTDASETLTYSWAVAEVGQFGLVLTNLTGVGGVIASLVKKDLAFVSGDKGDDATVGLTEEGFVVWTERVMPHVVSVPNDQGGGGSNDDILYRSQVFANNGLPVAADAVVEAVTALLNEEEHKSLKMSRTVEQIANAIEQTVEAVALAVAELQKEGKVVSEKAFALGWVYSWNFAPTYDNVNLDAMPEPKADYERNLAIQKTLVAALGKQFVSSDDRDSVAISALVKECACAKKLVESNLEILSENGAVLFVSTTEACVKLSDEYATKHFGAKKENAAMAVKKVAKKVPAKKKVAAKKATTTVTKRSVGKTLGLSVQKTWIHFLETNNKLKLDDAALSALVEAELGEAYTAHPINSIRNRYNKGGYPNLGTPAKPCLRFDADGNTLDPKARGAKTVAKKAVKKAVKKPAAKKATKKAAKKAAKK
jgi:hypothetical protein